MANFSISYFDNFIFYSCLQGLHFLGELLQQGLLVHFWTAFAVLVLLLLHLLCLLLQLLLLQLLLLDLRLPLHLRLLHLLHPHLLHLLNTGRRSGLHMLLLLRLSLRLLLLPVQERSACSGLRILHALHALLARNHLSTKYRS